MVELISSVRKAYARRLQLKLNRLVQYRLLVFKLSWDIPYGLFLHLPSRLLLLVVPVPELQCVHTAQCLLPTLGPRSGAPTTLRA